MKKIGIWVEVTTLVVPGLNDEEEQLRGIANFLAGVGVDTPWHISRFHPDYKYTEAEATPIETLRTAYEIGKKAGLRYVYLGNVLEGNDTHCYNCGKLLVKRGYLYTNELNLKGNMCPRCNHILDGVF
jgi:pyruvate formate lyase activating enzyme